MPEKPKRLAPKLDVLRELYLKSGNQCAFPGCNEVMIDSDGVFVGEICHIEAALPGGERFNPNQTNEERRAFSNLMLMCHPHHKRTNDTHLYRASRHQEIKARHEAKYSDVAQTLQRSISDITEDDNIRPCKSLERINQILEWGNSEQELSEVTQEIIEFGEKLSEVPVASRQLFLIIVKRAERRSGFSRVNCCVSAHETEHVSTEPLDVLKEHYQMLDRRGLIGEGAPDDFGKDQIEIKQMPTGWDFVSELKEYCGKTGIDMAEIIVDLNFQLLDE